MLPSQNESQRALKENTAMVSEYLRSVGKIHASILSMRGNALTRQISRLFSIRASYRLSLGE